MNSTERYSFDRETRKKQDSRYRGMYYDYMTGLPNMAYFMSSPKPDAKGCRKRMWIPLFFSLT